MNAVPPLRQPTVTDGMGIGKHVPRKEDLRLLTGKGMFSDDVNLPRQLYAAMVRSPHAHARILDISTPEALAVPGVVAVLTGKDLLADGLTAIPHPVVTRGKVDIPLDNK